MNTRSYRATFTYHFYANTPARAADIFAALTFQLQTAIKETPNVKLDEFNFSPAWNSVPYEGDIDPDYEAGQAQHVSDGIDAEREGK